MTVRVFIGSGEASRLERKTLIHSLRAHSRRDLDVYVFNGTHNAIERNDAPPVPAPLPLAIKYRNVTEFSNYRFLIPEICGHQGRAIWLDSDTVCLADIGELFDVPMDGHDFLARADADTARGSPAFALSVMVIDCGRCRFDLERYFMEIDAGLYTSEDLHRMTPAFLTRHPFHIGRLDPDWNVFDRHDAHSKLVHYTNLRTQPWKYAGHPFGELWFRWFRAAMAAGALTPRDVELSIDRGYVRPDVLAPRSPSLARQVARGARRWLRRGLARSRRERAR